MYRSTLAAFEFGTGSVFGAIIPAAFKGSFVGSICVAMYTLLFVALPATEISLVEALGTITGLLFLLFVCTLIGTFVAIPCIAMIGVPIAATLGKRIEKPATVWVALSASAISGIAIGVYALTRGVDGNLEEIALMIATILAYALPCGWFYRDQINASRAVSRWRGAGD